jgi:hypothetical protein
MVYLALARPKRAGMLAFFDIIRTIDYISMPLMHYMLHMNSHIWFCLLNNYLCYI